MTQRFVLQNVQYMPAKLEPGIVYVAEAFGAAAHLCACGCRTVVRTPLDRWSFIDDERGPSLYPSIGNWQEPCQSHYWIRKGEVIWARKWSSSQILAGRRAEEKRREHYYDSLYPQKQRGIKRLLRWIKELF
jgi:hypothetical protein